MGELPGVFEAMARIVHLGSTRLDRVAGLRAAFETRAGSFSPDDPWFEERSRAFWTQAVTRERFGRDVAERLTAGEARWAAAFERAHRGLFRAAEGAQGVLVDVWSGAELLPTHVEDDSRAELAAASGQLFDAWVAGLHDPLTVALLPGAVFHARQSTPAIEVVLQAARATAMSTHDALDALLRMERKLRSLSRVKPEYAYRADALAPEAASVRAFARGLK